MATLATRPCGIVVLAVALSGAGCNCESFERGTLFACDRDGNCPPDHICVDDVCEPCQPDAGPSCMPASCFDDAVDGLETDFDCGGGMCAPCEAGAVCGEAEDCASGACEQERCQPGPCENGHLDEGETDVDCGGRSCDPCPSGRCLVNEDCVSNICFDGECQLNAACTDLQQNGFETDVDCGGSECPRCEPGQECAVPGDCTSNICSGDHCLIQDAEDDRDWVLSQPAELLTARTDGNEPREGRGSVVLEARDGLYSYGSGADGDCLVAAGQVVDLSLQSCSGRIGADAQAEIVEVDLARGTASVPLVLPAVIGDVLLLVDLGGHPDPEHLADTGHHEVHRVVSVGGGAITLDTPLRHDYFGDPTGDGPHQILLQRLPQYHDVTVEAGGTLTVSGFDCSGSWGVLAFAASGTVSIAGAIDVTGRGYEGGSGGRDNNPHASGDSWGNACGVVAGPAANFGGGGGGGAGQAAGVPGGGGGGSYGVAGAEGGSGGGGEAGGAAGNLYGSPELAEVFLGSGGGEGGNESNGPPGTGGAGGGLVLLFANRLTVLEGGAILSNGAGGGPAGNIISQPPGGGGGGSGGTVLLEALDATVGEALVRAEGGAGSVGGPAGGGLNNGGDGGAGRIAVYFQGTAEGTTVPVHHASQTLVPASGEGGAIEFEIPLDLSGASAITLWVRTDMLRLPMRLQIGETASSELTFDFEATDSWQQVTWDLAAIAAGARDEIRHLAFVATLSCPPFWFQFDAIDAVR